MKKHIFNFASKGLSIAAIMAMLAGCPTGNEQENTGPEIPDDPKPPIEQDLPKVRDIMMPDNLHETSGTYIVINYNKLLKDKFFFFF
jgi:hypothetical protein